MVITGRISKVEQPAVRTAGALLEGGNELNNTTGACYIVGLTGGTGSGKSEASRILEGFGAAAIDVDKVAREVMDEPDVLASLSQELGSFVIGKDGKFARSKASEIAFHDKEFLEKLSSISHSFTTGRVTEIINDVRRLAPGKIIVIDAPIPIERGFLDLSDEVWVMTADYDIRLERIMARDRLSRREAEARMTSQMSSEEYEKLADRIIPNNGSYAELKESLDFIWKKVIIDMLK